MGKEKSGTAGDSAFDEGDLKNLLVPAEICVLLLDADLRIRFFTPKFAEIFDVNSSDINRSVHSLTPKVKAGDPFRDLGRLLQESGTTECELQTEDGAWFLVKISSHHTPDQEISGLLLTFTEITDRKRAEEELQKMTDLLESQVNRRTAELVRKNLDLHREAELRRSLQKKLLELSVQHQRSLGEQLHDSLAQHLYATRILAKNLLQKARSGASMPVEQLEQLSSYLEAAEKEARSLARGLIPVEFEGARGLVAAIERMVYRINELSRDLVCRLEADSELTLTDDVAALELYYIAREAVNNALRHAQATRIIVRLRGGDGGEIILEVDDNGIGIREDVLRECPGVGINIMRHRAELIEARLEILRKGEGGTLVRCALSGS